MIETCTIHCTGTKHCNAPIRQASNNTDDGGDDDDDGGRTILCYLQIQRYNDDNDDGDGGDSVGEYLLLLSNLGQ